MVDRRETRSLRVRPTSDGIMAGVGGKLKRSALGWTIPPPMPEGRPRSRVLVQWDHCTVPHRVEERYIEEVSE
jgi:hypothetical protein